MDLRMGWGIEHLKVLIKSFVCSKGGLLVCYTEGFAKIARLFHLWEPASEVVWHFGVKQGVEAGVGVRQHVGRDLTRDVKFKIFTQLDVTWKTIKWGWESHVDPEETALWSRTVCIGAQHTADCLRHTIHNDVTAFLDDDTWWGWWKERSREWEVENHCHQNWKSSSPPSMT